MPATRNYITKKPIMTTAPNKPKWPAFDEDGDPVTIWADTLEEAEKHAHTKGWTLAIHREESK